jgi:endoglucanase
LDWGYDLSGVAKDFALHDQAGGNGIMYSSHIYPWKKDWQINTLDAAAKYPIFVGEVGTPPDWSGFKFIPENERYEDLSKGEWAPDMIGLIQKYKLNWTGFSFHPKCGPCAILDWNYTPTPYWGQFVKDALAGKQFHVKRMR